MMADFFAFWMLSITCALSVHRDNGLTTFIAGVSAAASFFNWITGFLRRLG